MMKKLTEKQEAFCRAFVETGEKTTAYKMAYRADKMKPAVIAVKSCELASEPHVAARIEELRDAAKERNKITLDTLLAELEENRQAALCAEVPQSSAATAATMGKAKLLGLDKQIIEHTGPGGSALTPTVIQLVGPGDDDSQA